MSIQQCPVEIVGSIFSLSAEWDYEGLALSAAHDIFRFPADWYASHHKNGAVLRYRLENAASVCKTWRDIARPYKYRSIILKNAAQLNRFTDLVKHSQEIANPMQILFGKFTSIGLKGGWIVAHMSLFSATHLVCRYSALVSLIGFWR